MKKSDHLSDSAVNNVNVNNVNALFDELIDKCKVETKQITSLLGLDL